MSTHPLISVIVPCYNQAKYLNECLESVLSQSFQNWECIIINDGSPDETEEIAQRWTAKDTRFRYLKKENGGVASARNFAIERAEGKWILPLDADDKIGQRYLEFASAKFSQDYNVIGCKVSHFGNTNNMRDQGDFEHIELLYSSPVCVSTLFLKSDWVKTGGFDTNLKTGLEDSEFWINLFSKCGFKFIEIDYVGLYYRIKSVSRSKAILSDNDDLHSARRYIMTKHKDLYVSNIEYVSHKIHNEKSQRKAIDLLLKSRIIKFLNKLGYFNWLKNLK